MKRITILLFLCTTIANNLIGQNLKFSGGHNHSVYLCQDGRVYSTGSNHSISGAANGQLGTGDTLNRDTLTPVLTGDQGHPSGYLSNVIQVHAGSGDHTMALTSDGEVYAWGNNRRGMLGIGTNDTVALVPRRVVTGDQNHPSGYLSDVVQICTGNESSHALLKSGRVMSWGSGSNGQLGLGGWGTEYSPRTIFTPDMINIVQIDAGDDFGVALRQDGTVWAWGNNNNRQMAHYNDSYNQTPEQILDSSNTPIQSIVKIAAGDQHVLALTAEGKVLAWGGDWKRQLGYPTFNPGPYSEDVLNVVDPFNQMDHLSNIVDISAGNSHSLALTKDGLLYKWGAAYTENFNSNSYIPVRIYGNGQKVKSISTGDNWRMWITEDEKLHGSGLNDAGQLGFNFNDFTPPCEIANSCNNYIGLEATFELCSSEQNALEAYYFPDSTIQLIWYKNGNEIVGYDADSLLITQSGDTYSAIKITTNDPSKPGNYCNGLAPILESYATHQSFDNHTSLVNCFTQTPSLDTFLIVSGNGNYSWWDQQINGNQLLGGDTMTVNYITSDTSFFIQDDELYNETAGYQIDDIYDWSTSDDTLETTIHFNALSDFVLDEITIEKSSHLVSGPCSSASQSDQIITIYIMDELNNVLHSFSPVIGCTYYGEYEIPVNFNITKQDNLRLVISNSYDIKFRYNPSGADYNEIGTSNTVKLKYSGSANDDSYGMFYDWQISYGSPCSRYPIKISDNCPPTIGQETIDSVNGQFDFDLNDFDADFMDPDGDELSSISITTLPKKGSLRMNGQDVSAGQKISRSDIQYLVYIPDLFENGNDTIEWTASDGHYSSETSDFILNIIVDPTITYDTILNLNVIEGDTTLLTQWQVNFNNFYTYNDSIDIIITSQSNHGLFYRSDDWSSPLTSFTQGDVHENKIYYIHDNSETELDSIEFYVTNQSDTIYDLNLNIRIDLIDDISINRFTALSLNEGDTVIISANEMHFENHYPTGNPISIVFTSSPNQGFFAFNTDLSTPISSFTQNDIDSLHVSYIHNNGNNVADSITFYVANNTDTIFNLTLNINITPIDDITISTLATLNIDEGDTTIITTNDIFFENYYNSGSPLNVVITTNPLNGYFALNSNLSSPILSFTQANINNSEISYVHNNGNNITDSLIFYVANNTDTIFNLTLNINITPIDDITISTLATLNIHEGDTMIITTNNILVENYYSSGSPINIIITTNPLNGYFALNSNLSSPISSFTQANINNAEISYVHNNGNNIVDSLFFYVANNTDTVFDLKLNIFITPIDDDTAKLSINNGLITSQGTSIINSTHLNATDDDSDNNSLVFTITTAPSNGYLALQSNPLDTIFLFTQDDLNNSRIIYITDSSLATNDLFIFSVSDGTNEIQNLEFSISKLVSNTDDELLSKIIVGPNPTNSFVNVLNAQSIKVLDLNGVELISTQESQIDLSHLPSGNYIFEIQTGVNGIKKIVRIIKQ